MLQSPVLSKASKAVRSKLDTSSNKTDTTNSSPVEDEREPEAEQASCRCPSCDEMTDIEGIYVLAPNEEHIEPCSNCGINISMEYNTSGEWTIKTVRPQDSANEDKEDEELSTLSFQ